MEGIFDEVCSRLVRRKIGYRAWICSLEARDSSVLYSGQVQLQLREKKYLGFEKSAGRGFILVMDGEVLEASFQCFGSHVADD